MSGQAESVVDAAGGTETRTPLLVWIALAVALLAAIAGLASGPGNRFGWWDYRMAFGVLGWAAWSGLAGAVLSVVAIVHAARRRARTGIVLAAIGILAGALTFGLPWQLRSRAHDVPPIHDITTDTDNPPHFVAVLPLRKGVPNSVEYAGAKIAAQQKKAFPDIAPLALPVPPKQAYASCLAAARSLGWEIVAEAPGEGRIEATDTTPFFGFKDDIVIRITPAGTESRVDVRSVSRVGRSDLGTNARRLRAFLARLRSEAR